MAAWAAVAAAPAAVAAVTRGAKAVAVTGTGEVAVAAADVEDTEGRAAPGVAPGVAPDVRWLQMRRVMDPRSNGQWGGGTAGGPGATDSTGPV